MNQTQETLNLARKWRPKNFDQIVGQEISIRMLKNGLYLKKLFPVYLFAGQRGCGKTTTARVFGTAINCKNLDNFRQNPTENKIPCLECDSCKSMLQANHPDFIEIDAASHTGVDNVREILQACTYMPLFGNKKIYLIDEAHMLSKAAFNAFLKILEEPPASTLFILATTEIQRFPQTVLSRCFQVIFKPVENLKIKDHLKNICNKEEIDIQDQALSLLIQETEGSVRDAINLLERVRFSEKQITTESLQKVLGKISEKELFNLFDILLDQNPQKLLAQLHSPSFQNINPQTLWNMIVQLCRTLLWIKFDTPTLPGYFNDTLTLKNIADKCSLNRLNAIMQLLWSQEELFLKTPNKQIFLEIILLQICQQVNIANLEEILKLSKTEMSFKKEEFKAIQKPPTQNLNQIKIEQTNTQEKKQEHTNSEWQTFLSKISKIDDHFLTSAINQIKFIDKNPEKKLLNVNITNNNAFLKDKIKESKNIWQSYFQECFQGYSGFNFIHAQTTQKQQFTPQPANNNPNSIPKTAFNGKNNSPNHSYSSNLSKNTLINISDKAKWPKANLIAKYFPGRIKMVRQAHHERISE